MEVVLNFGDFTAACRFAGKNCLRNSLGYDQFLPFPDDRSNSLIKKSTTTISQICAAKFNRGSPQGADHDQGYVARAPEGVPISKEEH